MTTAPTISLHPKLILDTAGTTLRVSSLDQAVVALSRQATALGSDLHLLIEDTEPITLTVTQQGAYTPSTIRREPDATLRITAWVMYIGEQRKFELPTLAQLLKSATLAARQHGQTHIDIHHIMSTTAESLTTASQKQEPTPPPETVDSPPTPDPTPGNDDAASEAQTPTAPEPATPEPVPSMPDDHDEPEIEPEQDFRTGQDPATHDDEHTDITHEKPPRKPHRGPILATSIGLATALLIAGAMAAGNYLTRPAPNTPNTSATPASQQNPPIPGANATPLRQFPKAYSDLAISTDGTYIALQTADNEVTITHTLATGDDPETVLKLDAKITAPILPLSAPEGNGFIIRTTGDGSPLNSQSTLTVWTEEHGSVEHELPIGSTIAHRAGHTWITSTIATTGPRTAQVINAKELATYTAPTSGPALFALTSENRALWASLASDNSAGIIIASPDGNTHTESTLERPNKSSTVARWLTATETHALMLWQHDDKHILAIHDVQTGKITDQNNLSTPSGTHIDQLVVQTSANDNIALFNNQWADLSNGKLQPPNSLTETPETMEIRHGGIEVLEPTHTFIRTDRTTIDVPDQGNLLAVTPDAILIEDRNIISIYTMTTPTKGN